MVVGRGQEGNQPRFKQLGLRPFNWPAAGKWKRAMRWGATSVQGVEVAPVLDRKTGGAALLIGWNFFIFSSSACLEDLFQAKSVYQLID